MSHYELEQRTKLISADTYNELIGSNEFIKIQETPKNILTTYSLRYDEERGGIFLWSGAMQRYYLIAKRISGVKEN